MDTIQIAIKINENKLRGITYRELQEAGKDINSITSIYGYRYCDYLEISKTGNLIIKISYPRFFDGINVFLISNSMECLQVQYDFCSKIFNHPLLCDAELILNRIDIPFTFMMGINYNFNSYKKIYQVLNYVYKKKNEKANPKAYTDIEKFKAETLIYADTLNISAYNSKITIYDQYENIKTKTADEQDFLNITSKYDYLCKRMRIEVSKRVQRKGFTIEEFSQFNIFKEYSWKYKNYILENFFDLNEVENFYNENAQYLARRLSICREARNFNYRNFIYMEINNIYDYEIIRRALNLCIDNVKTKENAITEVRKTLIDYQLNENIIVMATYATIKEIKEIIEKSFMF